MTKRTALAALVLASVAAVVAVETRSVRLRAGFVGREKDRIAGLVSAARIDEQTALLSRKPHRAGTPANAEVAGLVGDRLQRVGLKVWNTPWEVELYEPIAARLSLVGAASPPAYDLAEEGDGDPAGLAFSPDADLAATVVYANYGARADYDLLRRNGISVKGKVVLVRAQGICRGMKAGIAAGEGAAGLLLFPEPRDQGFAKPAFPDGPNVPRWAIPRGTLLRYDLYPGDPASARARGISTRPTVPALGVSQAVAEDLLSRMRGDAVPDDWKGWLKAPYVLARDGPRVRLTVKGQVVTGTIRNLYAILPGASGDAKPVMVGNHYDAWERGAVDPGSGTAVVLEAAEALARLRDRGWQPERTILFSFWDGEEAGMYGSTKWVEQTQREQFGGLAAYVNVDSAVRADDFVGNVVPGLRAALDEVLAAVPDPAVGRSVASLRGAYHLPGFSSDAGPFLGLTTTPVAEIGFGRWFPVYHTRADTVEWIRRFGDPGSARAALLARILALYVGSLASEPVFPFRFSEVSDAAREALRGLESRTSVAAAWSPYARTFLDSLERYEPVARRWDGELRRFRTLPLERGRGANPLVERAIAAFGAYPPTLKPGVFGRGSVLIGPSDEEGCSAEPLAPFQHAVRVRDFDPIRAEGELLARAFSQAAEYLRAAELVGLRRGPVFRRRR